MSASNKVDLEALSRPRAEEVARPRRHPLVFLLPTLVLLGLLSAAAYGLRDWWQPAVLVQVIRPVAADGVEQAARGGVLVASAGWVEPDPYAVAATPLLAGTLLDLMVREGEAVEQGQVVAHLVREDAELALATATEALRLAEAKVRQARTRLQYAEENFRAPTDLTEAVASAEAQRNGARAGLQAAKSVVDSLDAAVAAAQSELELERYLLEHKATDPRKVELAVAQLAEVTARGGRLRAAVGEAEAELSRSQAAWVAAKERLELRIADRREVADAQDALRVAEAELAAGRVAVQTAELALSRTEVKAPIQGRVLHQHIIPGEAVGPNQPLFHLYDPQKLQVRADVPLEEIAKIKVGQDVEIIAEARRQKPYSGTVARVIRAADIQKVTLEVQVSIEDPDDLLVPESLVQVRFIGKAEGPAREAPDLRTLRLPKAAVHGGSKVWVVSVDGEAEARSVKVLSEDGANVVVQGELSPADRIIVTAQGAIEDGQRVRIQENR